MGKPGKWIWYKSRFFWFRRSRLACAASGTLRNGWAMQLKVGTSLHSSGPIDLDWPVQQVGPHGKMAGECKCDSEMSFELQLLSCGKKKGKNKKQPDNGTDFTLPRHTH